MKSFARRLTAGTDLRLGIEEMVQHYDIAAGAVMSATGLLSQVNIALSGGDVYSAEGIFVINSLTGTAAVDKVALTLSFTNPSGEVVIGEVLEGCVVADSVDLLVQGAIEFLRD